MNDRNNNNAILMVQDDFNIELKIQRVKSTHYLKMVYLNPLVEYKYEVTA